MGNEILLVDDDKDLLDTHEEILKLLGYTIISSTTSKHGLELYQSYHPCMAILDVRMPELNGYDLFSKIREFESDAKVVLVTGQNGTFCPL